MQSDTKLKIIFITDIHQNIDPLKKINFNNYDLILCGGDILTPNYSSLDTAYKIIDFLPQNTIFIPGNCDKNPDLINYIKKKMLFLHKQSTTIKNINILGIGYSRNIKSDIKKYRKYFLDNKKRIYSFNTSNLSFILKYCGIKVNNDQIEIYPEESGFKLLNEYAEQFVSFDEIEINELFTNSKLNNIDILVTHSPPYRIMDKLKGLPNIGSVSLREGIFKIKPKIVLCGHFHELYGKVIENNITFFNPGAIKDNKYGEVIIDEDKISVYFKTI